MTILTFDYSSNVPSTFVLQKKIRLLCYKVPKCATHCMIFVKMCVNLHWELFEYINLILPNSFVALIKIWNKCVELKHFSKNLTMDRRNLELFLYKRLMSLRNLFLSLTHIFLFYGNCNGFPFPLPIFDVKFDLNFKDKFMWRNWSTFCLLFL